MSSTSKPSSVATKGDRSTADRLYDLLDTLVAIRMDFGKGTEGDEALAVLGQVKMEDVRMMLDAAISSTKLIIGELDRPGAK